MHSVAADLRSHVPWYQSEQHHLCWQWSMIETLRIEVEGVAPHMYMYTSWHTSGMRLAVRLRISLQQVVGNPPIGQLRAWSIVNEQPQAHVVGRRDSCQPYILGRGHHEKPLCEGRTHGSRWGVLWWKLQTKVLSCCWLSCPLVSPYFMWSKPHASE